jgi:hypothetical protein
MKRFLLLLLGEADKQQQQVEVGKHHAQQIMHGLIIR